MPALSRMDGRCNSSSSPSPSLVVVLSILLVLLTSPANSQSQGQRFKVANVPQTTWTPQGTLAKASTDSRYCSFLCLNNPSLCSAFTINGAGQCEYGTIVSYVPLRTDGAVGKKVYIVNVNDNNNAAVQVSGQAPLINLTTVPHVLFNGQTYSTQDYSLNANSSPPLSPFPAPHPDMLTETYSFNFYRSGVFYVCGGSSQNVYVALIDDPAFVLNTSQSMLYGHVGGAAVDMGNLFWVTGGKNGSTPSSYSEYWQAGKWYPGPDLPIPITGHTVVAISSTRTLLVAGWNSVQTYNTAWTYDFSTGAWSNSGTYLGTPRNNHCGVFISPYVYVMGGSFSTILADVDVYDVRMGVWSVGPPLLSGGRAKASAVVVNGDEVLLMGGVTGPTLNALDTGIDSYVVAGQAGWNSYGVYAAAGGQVSSNAVLYNV